MERVPHIRIQSKNNNNVNGNGDYVLYWMIAYRRLRFNFSLQRAVEYAVELKKPLVILEALRCGYPWASDRLHRFIMDGMADNQRHLRNRNALYYPYLEPVHSAGKGLLPALSENACVVVTDDFPAFFIPRMVASAARKIPVLLEQVDSNGLLPMRVAEQVFSTAYAFRRFLQKTLPPHLFVLPEGEPLKGVRLPRPPALPEEITRRWPAAPAKVLSGASGGLSILPIDHGVNVVDRRGGDRKAREVLASFLEERLPYYQEGRNEPEKEITS